MNWIRPTSPPHVLVVDDDPSIREGLAMALAKGYVIHVTATGDEACAILRNHPVAAIVLDAILGDEHGLDLVSRFRALSSAPILLLTGHSTEDLAIRAVWAKVNGYLKKPFNLHDLDAALARLIFPPPRPMEPATCLRLHLNECLDKKFDLTALAEEYGLSEGHLRRRFRDIYGKTPRRYLTEVRMQQAAELLRTSWRTIEQIAREVGYPKVLQFMRVFKRRFAMTPSALRVRGPGENPPEVHPPAPES